MVRSHRTWSIWAKLSGLLSEATLSLSWTISTPNSESSVPLTGENVDNEALSTASLNVLAQAAVHQSLEKGASVKAISADKVHYASVFIDIADVVVREGTKNLRYGQISQAILCLRRMFVAEKKFGGILLVVEYRGEEVGSGSIAARRRTEEIR